VSRETEIRSADGTRLRVLSWDAKGDRRGQVFLVHGMGEHVGRYEHVGQDLADRGWEVHGLDLRGWGRSGGLKGHVDGYDEYAADLAALLDWAPAGSPRFWYGHSNGSLVVLHSLLNLRDRLPVGAVLSGPPLKLAFNPPALKVAVGRLVARVLPRLRLGNELDSSLVCSDPEVVKAYDADPLVFTAISTRWYTSFMEAREGVQGGSSQISLPTLWMVGEKDGICDPEGSRDMVGRLGSSATLRSFPDLFHEIHNEKNWREVMDTVDAWMAEHASV